MGASSRGTGQGKASEVRRGTEKPEQQAQADSLMQEEELSSERSNGDCVGSLPGDSPGVWRPVLGSKRASWPPTAS